MKYGSTIYVAKYDKANSSNGIARYLQPISFVLKPNYLSIQPASGYTAVQIYGKEISQVWNGIALLSPFNNVFHVGDLFYLDGENPQGEVAYGDNANAYIDSVRYQNQYIKLVIKKRVIDE